MNYKYNKDFYNRFKKFVRLFMKLIYRIEVNGIENIPEDTNYVLAGNHLNIFDSWLLIALTNKNIRFMVDKKLYKTKIGKWFFQTLGTFDIDPNEKDTKKNAKVVKNAVELLKSDEIVAIFPEGKTHAINVHIPFNGGVPAISKLGKTVLVPFGIEGTYKPFTKLKINIGTPINFKELKLDKEDENFYLEKMVRELEPYDGKITYLEMIIKEVINEIGEKEFKEEINPLYFNNKEEEISYLEEKKKSLKLTKKIRSN